MVSHRNFINLLDKSMAMAMAKANFGHLNNLT